MVQPSKQDIENAELARLDRLARSGDADAGRMLHWLLAMHLRGSSIGVPVPPSAAALLTEMHERLSQGVNPASAVLLGKPENRPIQQFRRERVLAFIADMAAFFEYAEANRALLEDKGMTLPPKPPSKAEIYRQAASTFGLKFKTVKNLHEAASGRVE